MDVMNSQSAMHSFTLAEQTQIAEVLTILIDVGAVQGPDEIAMKIDWAAEDLFDFIVAAENQIDYPLDSYQYQNLCKLLKELHQESLDSAPDNVLNMSFIHNQTVRVAAHH
ncbi:MAG: hypothetical protein C9356_15775 [Oleiphilus sp.]|nr:MAG: hypothetical protein C9356_15775 [Oleiphilus sp.]